VRRRRRQEVESSPSSESESGPESFLGLGGACSENLNVRDEPLARTGRSCSPGNALENVERETVAGRRVIASAVKVSRAPIRARTRTRTRTRGFHLAVLAAALAFAGCRCKGETKVGEKRAFACAEVPSKDEKKELDLGDGKRLIRDGVRASVRGLADDAPVAITSFDGGAAELAVPAGTGALFVVGLGGLPRDVLARSLTAMSKRVSLVVAVMGPEDEVDVARSAIADAGPRVVDGSSVRAFALAGLELVTVPGSDDPASLAEHGRGCVVRVEDVKALAQKLGARGRPRVALVYAAPSRNSARPLANDALASVSAWLVGGPLDDDAPEELAIPEGGRAPLIAIPRATLPRTSSNPGVTPPGMIMLRAEGTTVQLKREP